MKTKLLTMIAFFFLVFTPALQAKWWIFGGGEDEVGFDYLYVNTLSFDDVNKEAVFIKDNLDNGYLHVRGKARTGKNPVGSVSVSLDGAKTWQKAKFDKDGGFDFSFAPNLTQSYDIYVKVIDTAGKANEIDDAHIQVSFSDVNFHSLVSETLNKLKTSYEQEDDVSFMQYVSRDFEGDDMTLERALRKDFTALENIKLDFTINNIAMSGNRYYASITFNRSVIVSSNGTMYNDRGVTEFTFVAGEKGAMLLSMKNPLIFGLTYAADLAMGTTASAQNSQTYLSISDSGSVSQLSLSDIASGDSSNDFIMSGSFYLEQLCTPGPGCTTTHGFNFNNDSVASTFADAQVMVETSIMAWNGAQIQNIGQVGMTGITVPDTLYSGAINPPFVTNDIYAVKLPDNTYAIMQFLNSAGSKHYFNYKYNPNGSRTFP